MTKLYIEVPENKETGFLLIDDKHKTHWLKPCTSLKELMNASPEIKEEVVNLHIEIMKVGLIAEGDKKWSDGYEPKIREVAENYIKQTLGE